MLLCYFCCSTFVLCTFSDITYCYIEWSTGAVLHINPLLQYVFICATFSNITSSLNGYYTPSCLLLYSIATAERRSLLKLLIFNSRDLWLGPRLAPSGTQIFQLYISLIHNVIITNINLLSENYIDVYNFSQDWVRIEM